MKIRTTTAEKLVRAEIDPDRKVPLDVDYLNNSRRVENDGRVAVKWSARVMFWVQNVVATVAGF